MNKDMIQSSTPSYSKAFYITARMKAEAGEYTQALEYLDMGLDLEPDHPQLYNEKGYIMTLMKQYEDAYNFYLKATHVRPWAPANQKARAFRGMGYCLVEMGKLDEAEKMYKKSLEFESSNELALKELKHIKALIDKSVE